MFNFGIFDVSVETAGIGYSGCSTTDRTNTLRRPSSIYPADAGDEFREAAEKKLPRAPEYGVVSVSQLISAIGFVGGVAVEVRPGEVSVEWPGAAPWMVVWTHVMSASIIDLDLKATLEVARCTGVCVVALQAHTFASVTREDLARAMDVQRRKRLARGEGAFARTKDDDFVEEIKLCILRFLQRQLETSAWARLVRWLELPVTAPTDDELLAYGPSFGGEALESAACAAEIFGGEAAAEVMA